MNVIAVAQFLSVQERTVRYYLNGTKNIPYAHLGVSEAAYCNHHTHVYFETSGAKLRGLENRKMISQLVA